MKNSIKTKEAKTRRYRRKIKLRQETYRRKLDPAEQRMLKLCTEATAEVMRDALDFNLAACTGHEIDPDAVRAWQRKVSALMASILAPMGMEYAIVLVDDCDECGTHCSVLSGAEEKERLGHIIKMAAQAADSDPLPPPSIN